MSQFFVYIATKTTVDPFIPPLASNITQLSRDVSDAFYALQGGRLEVGKLAFFPTQRSVPNHLLCDGREVSQVSFPELYAYLGNSQGTPVGIGTFVLPNYLSGFTNATTAATETTNTGTVSTPTPGTPPPGVYTGRTDRLYGNVDSGGRLTDIP